MKKRSPKSTINRRVKIRRREHNWVAPEIPIELQIEILTRLPPKSLMRFKCVSKLWFSLIRSRYLTNRHLTVAPQPRPPRLYVSLVDHHLDCNSMEVCCHKPYESVLVSLSSSSSNQPPHLPTRPGLCINGVIYYLATTCMSGDIVVSFDVRSEEFSMIQGPEEGLVNLWVWEDGGKWSKESRVLKPCQMLLVKYTVDDLVVAGTTLNGEVSLIPLELVSPYYVLYYDLEKNDSRKVEIREIPEHWFAKPELDFDVAIYFKHMDESESIMHLKI